ncbi:DMT family transporter [Actinotalea sp. Marseille-Q4924]|uniref:EamA family transporter n=1 Tax=Actinotalea sp. Marseille-Q4924 TaxID=2866571 RepID=UPI001CE4B5B9|nr:DMT family transporter [Actinotalea sp. Marseille-Q4924]
MTAATGRRPGSSPAARAGGRPGVTALGPGLVLALVSAATFGSSGPFAKALLDSGWSPGAAVTARIGGAALLLLVPSVLLLRGRWHVLRRHAALMVVYGVVAMAAVQLAFFNAVTTLSVGVALLLEYLGVVLVVVWLWVRHGQRPRRWTLAGVVLSVAGLVLVLDLGGAASVDLGGVLWGLGAAVGLAAYFVLSAREAAGLPPLVMACGGMVAATVALVLAGALGVMPMTAGTQDVVLAGAVLPWWLAVLELVVVAAVLAYATGIAATRRLGSKVAGFVGLTEVMFSLVFAWVLLGELPLPVQLAGGALIVAGVLAVRYDELRGAVQPVVPPAPPSAATPDAPAAATPSVTP